MPDFLYRAMDAQGHPVQGSKAALDKHDLAAQLSAEGLFLVSATETTSEIPGEGAEGFTEVASNTSENSGMDENPEEGITHTTWKQRLALILLFIVGFTLSAYWQMPSKQIVEPKMPLHMDLSKIKPGMTRREIEKILPLRVAGKQDSAHTRYSVGNDTIVEITYDDRGGPWSENNRKIGGGIAYFDEGTKPPPLP